MHSIDRHHPGDFDTAQKQRRPEYPETVLDLLLFRAKHDTTVVAIRDGCGSQLTYGQWESHSAVVRDALRGAGVESGQHIGLIFDRRDWIEFAIAYFGVMRSGAIPVSIEHHPERISARVRHSRVSMCLIGTRVQRTDQTWLPLEELLTMSAAHTPDVELSGDSVLDIVYTSGTVGGQYKAVRCRHSDWVTTDRLRPIRRNQSCVHALFQTHSSAGLHGLLLGHLERGVTSIATAAPILYAGEQDARQVAAAISEFGPYEVMATPPLLGRMLDLDLIDKNSFSTVRYIKVGGSPLPAPIGRRVLEALPSARIVSLYGTTESAKALLTTFWDQHEVDVLGAPGGITSAKVVDDAGNDLPSGEIGEICVRAEGGSGKLEYFEDAETTEAVFESGWIHTGDLGYWDDRRRIRLVGRTKEMLILPTGMKVNSFRIEQILRESPEIKDVSVVGLEQPDKPYDLIAAAIVPKKDDLTTSEVKSIFAALEPELVPGRYILVDDLPLNGMGKVIRRDVKKLFEEHSIGA
ncbi:acyl--CoA ligase (plasmid) [Streptomyces viridifaciens]|nr:acyl--CoA ligase [Streptomyces viridifaciens]